MKPTSLLLAILSLVATAGCTLDGSADLVLTNGKIVTVDDALGEVAALAVTDGRVAAVGSAEEIDAWIGPFTEVIDLDGRTAIPGFIEGHGHFTGIGRMLQNLDLRFARDWDDVARMVGQAVADAAPGDWILGRGWHQEKWESVPVGDVEGFPTHEAISAVSPDNPVCLTHASGHACFFNARAMELAGIDADTPDPSGGEILRDASGRPVGIFIETAQGLVGRKHREEMAKRTDEEVRRDIEEVIRLADEECLRKGVTSFQDAGSPFGEIAVMRDMAERGEYGVRLWVMVRESNERLREHLGDYLVRDVGEDRLTVAALKRTIDGALGSRGAWLLAPYTDEPTTSGLNTVSVEDVTETARIAADHGIQLCVHAIGDRANREVLDIFEQTFESRGGMDDHRWRVEHAQHLNPLDIPRFASLGVIASMQGVHCTSDGPWVHARLGEQRAREGAYIWRTLMQSGALVTNGTDAPVEDVSPIASFYATVSRRLSDGSVFYPDQRLSRMDALKTYTINCAISAFEEEEKGTLTPGKLADIVVLSNDILTVPEEQILDTEVLYTIVGGEVLYRAEVDGGT